MSIKYKLFSFEKECRTLTSFCKVRLFSPFFGPSEGQVNLLGITKLFDSSNLFPRPQYEHR